MNEQIYIIGAGAIGKALAVFLNAQGRNVMLIRGSVDQDADQTLPLEVEMNDGKHVKASVPVSTFSQQKRFEGVIVLTNKSLGNSAIASALQGKAGQSPLVVMQNGLDIEQPFLEKKFPHIYRCVLFATSQPVTDYRLRFKPVSVSPIGLVGGDRSLLPQIAALLDTPPFRFQGVSDIRPILWKKVIANCVFNSICPLLETDNGIFHRNETARLLALDIIEECIGVAQEEGIALDRDEVLQTVLQISKASDGQIISTLQDIRNKRATEIDSLNFAIAKKAGSAGAPKTKMLGDLTRLKSDLSLG